jgi:hypothetical protein
VLYNNIMSSTDILSLSRVFWLQPIIGQLG